MLDISADLSTADYLQEQLYKYVVDAKRQEAARKELNIWLRDAKESEISELKSAITAYINWKDSIIAFINQPITNGLTNGYNNKNKMLRIRILLMYAA